MLYRSSICAVALVGAFCITIAGAPAWDDSKYPDFGGQWRPIGGPGRFARDQKAPLTPEYQAIFEADESEGSVRSSRVNHQGEVDMDVHRHAWIDAAQRERGAGSVRQVAHIR